MLNPPQQLPVCTVITSCYNYGRWMDTAIQSVIDQDYPSKQMVIVDDASTDNSYQLIQDYLVKVGTSLIEQPKFKDYTVHKTQTGPPIYLLHTDTNRERSISRNVAIEFSFQNTHIFSFLDADDYFKPERLSKCIIKMIQHPDKIGVVYTDNIAYNVEGDYYTREIREPFSHRILQHNMVHSSAVLISRPVLEKIGLFGPEITGPEDFDLVCRAMKHFMIVHIPEALIVTRTHKMNSTNTLGRKWQEGWQRIAKKLNAS